MISVVVPALNEEGSIEACLRSIRDQDHGEDIEIIVVDGGSRDSTVSLAEKYADRIIPQRGLGIGGARRDGASAARGEKIAFTDADSIAPEGWLDAVAKNLESFDASTGPVVYMVPDLRSRIVMRWRDLYRLLSVSGFHYIIGSNMAVRAEAYWKIGGHRDISLLDDYDLSLRLFQSGSRSFYDGGQVVHTSSRRTGRLLAYAVSVARGHYYYLSGKHDRLLHYPRPEEMGARPISSIKERIKRII